jgi:hypothetical protein
LPLFRKKSVISEESLNDTASVGAIAWTLLAS